jgi:hypothetical protein
VLQAPNPTDDGETSGDIKDDRDQPEHGKGELLSENPRSRCTWVSGVRQDVVAATEEEPTTQGEHKGAGDNCASEDRLALREEAASGHAWRLLRRACAHALLRGE